MAGGDHSSVEGCGRPLADGPAYLGPQPSSPFGFSLSLSGSPFAVPLLSPPRGRGRPQGLERLRPDLNFWSGGFAARARPISPAITHRGGLLPKPQAGNLNTRKAEAWRWRDGIDPRTAGSK